MKKIQLFIILTIGISFYCYEFFLRILTGAYQEQIVSYFNIQTHTGFSFLISSYNFTYLLMQIPAGLLLDRFGSRKILIWATIICGLGNIIFILGDFNLAITGRLLVGIGSSFAFIGVLKLTRENLDTKYFALVTSIVISLGTLAAAFSQQLSVFVSSSGISWISVFIYSGLLSLPLALLFYLFVPTVINSTTMVPNFKRITIATLQLLKNKNIWTNATWASLIYIPTIVLTSQYGVFYFKSIHNVNDYLATSLVTSLFMGWVIFSPIMAIITNKYGVKKTFLICVIGMLVTILLLSSKSSNNKLMLLTFLFGSFSAIQVLVWYFFNNICPNNISGIGIAVTNMIITLLTEIGQLSVGISLDISDYLSFENSANTITVCFIIFTVASFFVVHKFIKRL